MMHKFCKERIEYKQFEAYKEKQLGKTASGNWLERNEFPVK